jgi:hypothetical protein
LSLDAIREQATRSGTSNRIADWRRLVLLHKEAGLVYRAAPDADGRHNPTPSNEWISRVAGYITFQWAARNDLLPHFESFTRVLPGWVPLGSLESCGIELFRFYLWLMRHGEHPGAIQLASTIRSVYPEFPVITAS